LVVRIAGSPNNTWFTLRPIDARRLGLFATATDA